MGITDIKLDRTIIHYADDSVNAFINEWHNSSDYIYAHTSGSTGVPKKIELSKTDMIKSASATCEFFNINENSKFL